MHFPAVTLVTTRKVMDAEWPSSTSYLGNCCPFRSLGHSSTRILGFGHSSFVWFYLSCLFNGLHRVNLTGSWIQCVICSGTWEVSLNFHMPSPLTFRIYQKAQRAASSAQATLMQFGSPSPHCEEQLSLPPVSRASWKPALWSLGSC